MALFAAAQVGFSRSFLAGQAAQRAAQAAAATFSASSVLHAAGAFAAGGDLGPQPSGDYSWAGGSATSAAEIPTLSPTEGLASPTKGVRAGLVGGGKGGVEGGEGGGEGGGGLQMKARGPSQFALFHT